MSCIIDSNRTVTFLDCSDSGLSISGNVISILTFFVAAIATYLAFFQDVRDIPQSADDYSNDIRSLHDQLWTIGDIHSQLAKLVANSENALRLSDVHLQSRLQQGQSESLKEAKKFLDDYSASYQDVFTNYFKRHRWVVRLKWLFLQNKVEHYKREASELRSVMTLDLLAVTLKYALPIEVPLAYEATSGSECLALMLSPQLLTCTSLSMNIALQHSLKQRDLQAEKLARRLEALMNNGTVANVDIRQDEEEGIKPDSPSPSVMMDPTDLNPPTLLVSPPEGDNTGSQSRSPSPFSTRRPLGRSMSD